VRGPLLIERALAAFERLFLVAANLCLLVMLAINALNIAVRGVLDLSFTWVWPWTLVLFVWMTFLGFFVIYRRNKDITVDFFIGLAGERARFLSRLLADLIVIALMLLILWQAPTVLAAQVGELELTGLQRWTLSVPLFVSAGLLVVHHALDLVLAFTGAAEPVAEPAAIDA
jgi:TRAP-type C4-dicarboxylate transport system permease small subunit